MAVSFKELLRVNLLKTVYVNYKYLQLGGVKTLPIYVYNNTRLSSCRGKVVINGEMRRGMIRIGKSHLPIVDRKSNPSIWKVDDDSTVVFNGRAYLNQGVKISVGLGGTLVFGDHVTITGRSEIVCNKRIDIGNNCLISWDVLFLDDDAHKIYDKDGILINESKAITIEDNVWIGCRNTILKGSRIPHDSVIACGSIITKQFNIPNTIIGGSGKNQHIIASDIYWKRK